MFSEAQVQDSPLAQPPSKIIAVHISYESRAAERGRRPEAPSYFLKPTSSVAASGRTVERPPGTELLAFEGEIALIIGTAARRVSVEQAWHHVSAITASNDWGLYDLRWADKGSNLRNKGRDGYTPLGPDLITAEQVDPSALRLRTWKNGQLVQEDTTGNLIFPFAQLIADLSQHLTLEPGDVILTGTPAGASVAQPGDTLEVEVDAPAAGLSSGRLVSTVIEGTDTFAAEVGAVPKVNDLQREEAWGSRHAAGLPAAAEPVLTAQLKAKLREAPVAGLSQEMRKRGLNNVTIDGVSPTRPGSKMVGTAKTLRFVPNREDLFSSHGGGFNAQKQAFDQVSSDEVIVIEARGESGSGTLGDILALRAAARGAAGVVTDGGVRDYATVAAIDLPVYSRGAHPAVLGRKHVPWDTDLTIACGGATIQPGDIIVADDDGVIVLPPALAEEVADAALAKETEDAWVAEQVKAGHPIQEVFPMNAQWRARYEAERAQG
ncbi:fumarylacetoacetate hydrolase family protein [Nesterenkonia sphaerica]|uniref:Fumarylacetoacetate hydrolase family protein n=1 Tax=Nesterenkonia sphaerica TaxID=1804988 RepID=A0A5R9AK24_9MICC|nr:fumarylacetoacetate hydrolase family protein [Nesterenkonia sphaerica]TLP78923.1 fumarylacetoacetate hydrolase family protein [Nesterenkonia sphaerica]